MSFLLLNGQSVAMPNWVPAAVVAEANFFAAKANLFAREYRDANILEKVRRLAEHGRMKFVWRVLKNQPLKQTPARLRQIAFQHQKNDSDVDIALRLTFHFSVCYAAGSARLAAISTLIWTAADAKQTAEWYRQRGSKLRRLISELQNGGIKGCWQWDEPTLEAFNRIAGWCEETAAGFAAPDPSFPQRNLGKDHLLKRWYCRELTECIEHLYGEPLRGTVATIATMALGSEVTKDHVRRWAAKKG